MLYWSQYIYLSKGRLAKETIWCQGFFLNLGTPGILGHGPLSSGGCPVHCRTLRTTNNTSSQCQKCPLGDKTASHWNSCFICLLGLNELSKHIRDNGSQVLSLMLGGKVTNKKKRNVRKNPVLLGLSKEYPRTCFPA